VRDVHWKWGWANRSRRGGANETKETIDGRVKAKRSNSCDVRSRRRPEGHRGRQERLESSGEEKLRDAGEQKRDIAVVDALRRDVERDRGCRRWGRRNQWVGKGVTWTAAFLKRLPSDFAATVAASDDDRGQ